jgi:hypothetical protein
MRKLRMERTPWEKRLSPTAANSRSKKFRELVSPGVANSNELASIVDGTTTRSFTYTAAEKHRRCAV